MDQAWPAIAMGAGLIALALGTLWSQRRPLADEDREHSASKPANDPTHPADAPASRTVAPGASATGGLARGTLASETTDEHSLERQFHGRQRRRRLQLAGLLGSIGILIILVDNLPIVRKSPRLFVVLVLVILLATMWLLLLAIADLFAVRAFHQRARLRLRQKQRELEQRLHGYRPPNPDSATNPPPFPRG